MTISQNLQKIHSSVAAAAKSCGRTPDDIKIVAVSKRFPAEAIEEAITAGQSLFGENYIQESEEKISQIGDRATFHFIGHLQRNKAKIAARLFNCIETIDSYKLAKSVHNQLEKDNKTLNVLIQVNIGADPNKAGVKEADAELLLRELQELPLLKPVGLMTMPPLTVTPEEARPYFKALRKLSEKLAKLQLFDNNEKVELSMGMSGDYPVAIEEGATIIRIGTAIFGTRTT